VASGEGIFISSNGQRYEGQMRNGMKNGEGIFYYIDGRVYKGTWEKDEIHGYGAE
jgi:hypothetical protein